MTPLDIGISTSTSSAARAGDIFGPTIGAGGSVGSGGGLLGALTGSTNQPWYVYLIVGGVVILGLVVLLKLWRRK
jgi:LPXTG-motif cell wall-anchored protein